MHVAEEKDAVIPAGNDAAVNDTAMGLPVTSVAVTVLAFDCPCAMDTLEDPAEREKLAPPRLAAVVNV